MYSNEIIGVAKRVMSVAPVGDIVSMLANANAETAIRWYASIELGLAMEPDWAKHNDWLVGALATLAAVHIERLTDEEGKLATIAMIYMTKNQGSNGIWDWLSEISDKPESTVTFARLMGKGAKAAQEIVASLN